MHCKTHQKGDHDIITGNRQADLAAKQAARRAPVDLQGMLVPCAKTLLNLPQYSAKEIQLAEKLKCMKRKDGWWETPNKQILITETMTEQH